jgi:hypothetical protein
LGIEDASRGTLPRRVELMRLGESGEPVWSRSAVTPPAERSIMRTRFCRLFVLTALAVALTVPAAAHASPGYTIDGLRVRPPVGPFGGTQVGSCDLVTSAGCKILTFTVENVGSDPILIGGFEVVSSDPLSVALLPSAPGSGCGSLPIVGGYWSLEPGTKCTISVISNPTQRGRIENELRLWYTSQSDLIAVIPLITVGT